MKYICEKMLIMFKMNKLKEILKKIGGLVNEVNIEYNVNEFDNILMKMLKVGENCNTFDVNEDKQRQCYKQLKCFWPKCRYSCEQYNVFNQHISHHLNRKQFVCEECNTNFNSSSNLLRHKRCLHSNNRPFVCNQINCNKTFKTNEYLKIHQLSHSSVKSFGCNKCDKKYKTISDLNDHKKIIHSNFRPFICSHIYCNKRFPNNRGLKDHKIRFHSGIKSHKCFHNNCDKSFVTSQELKRHIGSKHSDERPYKCNFPECNSSLKSQGNLYKHKKTVHYKK